MIREEIQGDRVLHWSDLNVWIRQTETSRVYESALDVIPCPYTYEETEEPIEVEND